MTNKIPPSADGLPLTGPSNKLPSSVTDNKWPHRHLAKKASHLRVPKEYPISPDQAKVLIQDNEAEMIRVSILRNMLGNKDGEKNTASDRDSGSDSDGTSIKDDSSVEATFEEESNSKLSVDLNSAPILQTKRLNTDSDLQFAQTTVPAVTSNVVAAVRTVFDNSARAFYALGRAISHAAIAVASVISAAGRFIGSMCHRLWAPRPAAQSNPPTVGKVPTRSQRSHLIHPRPKVINTTSNLVNKAVNEEAATLTLEEVSHSSKSPPTSRLYNGHVARLEAAAVMATAVKNDSAPTNTGEPFDGDRSFYIGT